MGTRSGTEKRKLTRHINLRIDERGYQVIADAAREANLEIGGWLRQALAKEVDALALLPIRKPTRRKPLPIDVTTLKTLTGHVGQLSGAILMLVDTTVLGAQGFSGSRRPVRRTRYGAP